MKKLICAFLLALPILGLPAQAQAGGGPLTISAGFSLKLWGSLGCEPAYPSHGCYGPAQLSPWYTYWPYEAHFQTPAYPQFPYWPAPMTSSAPTGYAAPYYTPPGAYAGAPTYWYGR